MNISVTTLAGKISRMDIFQSIPEEILLELAEKSGIERIDPGAVIFHKDQPGRSLYLLLEGAAKVHDADFVVAHMTAGSCFGELALLDEGPRSMSVTATAPTLVARIDRETFFEVLGDYPEVMQRIVGLLTRRLRFQTDQTVHQLRRREEELTRLVDERTAELMQQKEEAEFQRAAAEAEKQEAEFQRRRAEQSEHFEQQFLANMSHEIRTPMNAVMGMTRLLLKKNPREDQLRYLDSIRQSSEALLVILNDILDISKIQAGRLELEWTNLSVANILKSVNATLQFRAEENGLTLKVDCDPAIPPVLIGDPVRLQQILINLAGNAVKFTEKGSVEVIARQTGQTGNRCHLSFEVRDTGIGMSADQLAVVFESFRQASGDTTRKYGGTGLGLSISKQLADLFGGTISVESAVGVGSTFRFDVTLEIGTDHPEPEASAAELADALHDLRILLAEDNHFNRIVAIETLEMLIPGVQIQIAENGQEALNFVKARPFDLVLMDVGMPVMDGLEATRAIRALPPPAGKIPIIAFTASVTKTEVDKCLQAGMQTCVPKPFKTAELTHALMSVAGRHNTPPRDAESLPEPKEAPPEQAGTPPRLDFLLHLTGGNRNRMQKYIGLYLESATTSLPRIEAAMAAGDREELRRVVHTIKPQFRMIGMSETADLAQEIETQAIEGTDLDSLPGKVQQLLNEIRQSVDDFEAYQKYE